MKTGMTLPADRCSRLDPRVLKFAVDRRLAALLPARSRSGELGAAIHYSLLAPGKRLRPLLTLLAAWEFGPRDLVTLDAGCALEMVHAASLILDDMPAMDDSPERRGQAATHVRFGEDVAMLSAITLLNQSYATLAGMRDVDPVIRCDLIDILTQAVGVEGLAGGQYADLRPSTLGEASGIARANHAKTGALFVAAVEMAAAIRRLDDERTDVLRFCAIELGQAFQLLDDLIDSTVLGSDARSEDFGKATLLSLLGQDETRHRLKHHFASALHGLKADGVLATFVRSIFETGFASAEAV